MTGVVKQIATGLEDDAFSEPDSPEVSTILDSLRAELAKEVRKQPITLVVPARPAIALTFDPNLDAGVVAMWRKRATDKSMADDFNAVKFNAVTIANSCIGVKIDGQAAVENGKPLTFRSPTLLNMCGGATTAVNAVRWLFGADAELFRIANEIFKAAGYDESEVEAEDPTEIS